MSPFHGKITVRDAAGIFPTAPPASHSFQSSSPHRVNFRHPGYNFEDNLLFSLYAWDHDEGGIHHGLAHTACALVAGNRDDGYLSESPDGEPIVGGMDEVLRAGDYYFHIPHKSNDTCNPLHPSPYPIVPSFQHWKFPQTLPEPWNRLSCNNPIGSFDTVLPLDSREGVRETTCRITTHFTGTGIGHICPKQEREWFLRNSMHIWNVDRTLDQDHLLDDLSNTLLLRSDLLSAFNDRKFVFFPKSEHGFVVHMLEPTPELGQLYHNTHTHPLWQCSPQFLYARFAWAIFPYLAGFLSKPNIFPSLLTLTSDADGKLLRDEAVKQKKFPTEISASLSESRNLAFRYRPLDSSNHEIRLIEFLRSGRSEDSGEVSRIKCSLQHVSLNKPPKYFALSYVWEDPTRSWPILVDGFVVHIPASLGRALQQFYEDSTVLRLWADGICINQDDGVEKSHQVQQMALIYQRATKVLAWLGPAADGSDQLLKCIEKKGTIIIVSAIAKGADMSEEFSWLLEFPTRIKDLFAEEKDLRVLGLQQLFRKALKSPQMIKDLLSEISWLDLELSFPSHSYKKILERSLWKRIWILQEISLGSNVHLVCGNTLILYDYFIAVHSLVLSCMTILSDLGERWRDFYLELVPSLSVSTVATRHRLLGEEMSLLDMLDLTAGLAATDKRDYIFALLGLVNDVEALDIRPDYTVASGQVYKEVARKFLWYYGMRTLSWAPSSQRKPQFTRALIPLRLLSGQPLDDLEAENGLPSWVPDWSQRRPFHMIQPRQIELDISFSASGGSTQPISEEDQGEDWNIIALAACCVGIVTVCGSVQHPRAVLDSMTGSPTVVRTAARKFLNDLEALAVEHMGPSGLDKQRDEAIWWVPIMHRDPKMAPSPKRAEYGEISKRLHQSYLALRELPQPPEYGEPLESTTRPLLLPRHLPVSSAQGQTDVAEPSFLEGCYTRAKMLWPLNDGSEYLHMMHGAEMPFITDSRQLGIGPAAMQSGDQIHIFYGSEVPFILRPMDNGQYKFIGEAYVYGIMHGEFMRTNPPTHVINLE